MKTPQTLLLVSILGVLCAIPAASKAVPPTGGASDVRFISSFVPEGEPVPRECRQEARIFALSLMRYARPDSWHWVLVCDEAGWRRFLRLSGRDEGATIYASTDLEASTTYIRGDKLLYPYDLHADPDDIIAHELAHIRLHTGSEARADALVQVWQRREKQGLR